MGTATTYSTARSAPRGGTSSVLSDWAHNLSRGGVDYHSTLSPVATSSYETALWRVACCSNPSGDPCSFNSIFETRAIRRSCLDMHQKFLISTGYSTNSLLARIDTALSPIDTAPASPLGGSWALQPAALTPSRAAKPYRWQHGQAAHTATHRVNVRIGGLRQPPNRPPCTRRVIINLLETPRHHFHCTQHSFRASHVIHSCHNSQSVIHRHQRKAGSHGLFSSIPSP